MQTTIPQLSQILQQLLITDANQLGRSSGFVKRKRKLTGSTFASGLIFGWQSNPHSSLEELCQSLRLCGIRISPQGLQERLNSQEANEFLRQLLLKGVTYLVQHKSQREDMLASFTGVYVQDSSKIDLPSSLRTIWQGNSKQDATLKVQAVMDYQNGGFDLSLASGRDHDCPLQTVNLPSGSLRLADLGYFKVAVFKELNQNGVWWISRIPARAGVWQEDGVVHLAHWLQDQPKGIIDQSIELTAQRLSCRIIAVPLPNDVSQERRRRVREAAKARKKSQLKPETLALCDWTILMTNLPADAFAPDDILALQRVRWQIELLFKLWKSEVSLDEWRSSHPYQILSEVYAKLLIGLIQHWCLLLGCWHIEDRSLVKASRVLRKSAFQILAALSDLGFLERTLHIILPTLARCRVQKRKARPATFQLLVRAFP